ncbi:MAG: TolC family protein, partial [Thermoplasmata archaeon]|nr:TolC family protein [Thermoplasmata archaeon]
MSGAEKSSLVIFSILLLISPGFIKAAGEDETSSRRVTFDEVVSLALEKSYEMLLADEQLRAAERAVKNALRALHPRLEIQSTVTTDLLELDEFSGSRNIGTGMVVGWNFFQNGELRFRVYQARTNLKIARLKRAEQQREFTEQLRGGYYEALKKKRALGLSEKALQLEKRKLEILKQKAEQGETVVSEVEQAKIDLFENEIAYGKSKDQYRSILRRFEIATGIELIADVADIDRHTQPDFDLGLLSSLSTAYENRIEMKVARLTLDAA